MSRDRKNIATLEGLMCIQRDCLNSDRGSLGYMHGMLNGMIVSHSIFAGLTPIYHTRPRYKRNTKIRHKAKQ